MTRRTIALAPGLALAAVVFTAAATGPEGVDSVRVYVEKPPVQPGEAPGGEYRIARIYRPSPQPPTRTIS